MSSAGGGNIVSSKTPLGILVNICGATESSLVNVRRVLREFFGAMASLRHALLVASVNTVGGGGQLHRSVCALDAILKQIEYIQSPPSHRGGDRHGRSECACRSDFSNAMRLFQQAEYQILYITTPTTLPSGDEVRISLHGKSQGEKKRIQFVLLRSEEEDIQSSAAGVMGFVEATSHLAAVSIVQSEDNLRELRHKGWLRAFQSHIVSTIHLRPTTRGSDTSSNLHLILRSNFILYGGADDDVTAVSPPWRTLHAGLAHLTALHVVPLESVDGSVVMGLPLNTEAVEPNDAALINMQFYLRSNASGLVMQCEDPRRRREFYLLVAVGLEYVANFPFMLYRIASADQMLLAPETIHPSLTNELHAPPDVSFSPNLPKQRFNPFNYESGMGDSGNATDKAALKPLPAAKPTRPPKARRFL
ncbi:Aste57867_25419 [Aphanomyces stellatus]|uniref:Aste57867_25419 protein n=1 Tax=Aphanomyces stellatus TaxID=120398 RepID=A0A485LXU8_9STRA|nr:hypothetical protein As57867_025340 [Aphanomyces stellatus]VFU02043.1 Aste57867_25419 [Aphanomyces stellatus]